MALLTTLQKLLKKKTPPSPTITKPLTFFHKNYNPFSLSQNPQHPFTLHPKSLHLEPKPTFKDRAFWGTTNLENSTHFDLSVFASICPNGSFCLNGSFCFPILRSGSVADERIDGGSGMWVNSVKPKMNKLKYKKPRKTLRR